MNVATAVAGTTLPLDAPSRNNVFHATTTLEAIGLYRHFPCFRDSLRDVLTARLSMTRILRRFCPTAIDRLMSAQLQRKIDAYISGSRSHFNSFLAVTGRLLIWTYTVGQVPRLQPVWYWNTWAILNVSTSGKLNTT